MIVDHLLVRKNDYRDLFTTRETFLSLALATLYGVPTPPGWTPYEIPADSQRVGLLTQVAFLASHAHPGRSSPTLRGKALRELLLCQQVLAHGLHDVHAIVDDVLIVGEGGRRRAEHGDGCPPQCEFPQCNLLGGW